MRRALVVAVSLLGAVGLGGCSYLDPVGVTLRNGEPTIVSNACGKVEGVSLTAIDGRTLWEVRSVQPVKVDELAIGREPDGFVTDVRLAESLPVDGRLEVHLRMSGDSIPYLISFQVSDLRDGWVRENGSESTVASFDSQAPHCGRDWGLIAVVAAAILFVVGGCVALPLFMVSAIRLARPRAQDRYRTGL